MTSSFSIVRINGWLGYPLALEETAGFSLGDDVHATYVSPKGWPASIVGFYMDTGYKVFVELSNGECAYLSQLLRPIHEAN